MFSALRGMPLDLFFRDDDADDDLPELHRLLKIFGNRGVPISLAVIPGTLTRPGAQTLRRAADSGEWLELHQHGWRHENHERTGRKCEFGVSRDMDAQRTDIAQGWARLADMVGTPVAPVFTPPWNRCTPITAEVLRELGFCALSRERAGGALGVSLPEVSIAVDLFTWKGGAALKSPRRLGEEILRWAGERAPVGILLHHKVMRPEAFAMVEQLLDAVRSAARFHKLGDLCRKAN